MTFDRQPELVVIGSSRFEAPEGDSVLVDHTFLDRAYWGPTTYFELKTLMIEHALATVGTVQLRVGVDNARTRRAVENHLGAVHVDTVPTALGDDAVYHVTRDSWAAHTA
jgi:hypothetical protein